MLLEVKNELSNRDRIPLRWRYWIDPKRNHLVMRWEQTQLKNGAEEIEMAYSFRNLKKSPQGYWYPTRIHRENAIRFMDGTTSDYIWDYYLDFKAEIPDNLFDPNHR
ncbi:MAG: hypothetical protein IH899_16355 [Planctomycetes bacterium]|nr:hypothetical protein [Planctomycetota bacterium]